MNTFDLIDIAFSALERRTDPPVRSNPGTVLASLPQKDAPADLGTAEVGTLRYFVVRVERGRWTIYDRVQAVNTWAASKVAFDRNHGARCVQVMREIDRAEYDRFTRRSP